MPLHAHHCSAWYDADGNIILGIPSANTSAEKSEPSKQEKTESRIHRWSVTDECDEVQISTKTIAKEVRQKKDSPNVHCLSAKTFFNEAALETRKQFTSTAASVRTQMREASFELRSIPARMRGYTKAFWKAARTPLHLPGTQGRKKARTKSGLFIIDTIRFGGTFGIIFAFLFVGINYRSFWQIARAQLAIGTDISTEQALEGIAMGTPGIAHTSFEDLRRSTTQNIAKYLPAVGPFEDRLIVPKLGLNIPIVMPSMKSLMNEDWKQFEEDIQIALREGVVHYPGSARAGQAGNFFLTGHSSYYPWDSGKFKEVFARLHELEPGDTYSVYYGGDRHTYRITRKYEVKPSDVSVLDQPTDKRISTLMTCTPVGTTLRRLIVRAEEIEPETGEILRVGQKTENRNEAPFAKIDALPI